MTLPSSDHVEPRLSQASSVVPLTRRRSVSPGSEFLRHRQPGNDSAVVDPLEEHLIGSRELVRAKHVADCAASRRLYSRVEAEAGCSCPAASAMRAQTSVSGPKVALLRHAVHVVVFVHSSVFAADAEACLDRADDTVRPAPGVAERVLVAAIERVEDRERLERRHDVRRRGRARRRRVVPKLGTASWARTRYE